MFLAFIRFFLVLSLAFSLPAFAAKKKASRCGEDGALDKPKRSSNKSNAAKAAPDAVSPISISGNLNRYYVSGTEGKAFVSIEAEEEAVEEIQVYDLATGKRGKNFGAPQDYGFLGTEKNLVAYDGPNNESILVTDRKDKTKRTIKFEKAFSVATVGLDNAGVFSAYAIHGKTLEKFNLETGKSESVFHVNNFRGVEIRKFFGIQVVDQRAYFSADLGPKPGLNPVLLEYDLRNREFTAGYRTELPVLGRGFTVGSSRMLTMAVERRVLFVAHKEKGVHAYLLDNRFHRAATYDGVTPLDPLPGSPIFTMASVTQLAFDKGTLWAVDDMRELNSLENILHLVTIPSEDLALPVDRSREETLRMKLLELREIFTIKGHGRSGRFFRKRWPDLTNTLADYIRMQKGFIEADEDFSIVETDTSNPPLGQNIVGLFSSINMGVEFAERGLEYMARATGNSGLVQAKRAELRALLNEIARLGVSFGFDASIRHGSDNGYSNYMLFVDSKSGMVEGIDLNPYSEDKVESTGDLVTDVTNQWNALATKGLDGRFALEYRNLAFPNGGEKEFAEGQLRAFVNKPSDSEIALSIDPRVVTKKSKLSAPSAKKLAAKIAEEIFDFGSYEAYDPAYSSNREQVMQDVARLLEGVESTGATLLTTTADVFPSDETHPSIGVVRKAKQYFVYCEKNTRLLRISILLPSVGTLVENDVPYQRILTSWEELLKNQEGVYCPKLKTFKLRDSSKETLEKFLKEELALSPRKVDLATATEVLNESLSAQVGGVSRKLKKDYKTFISLTEMFLRTSSNAHRATMFMDDATYWAPSVNARAFVIFKPLEGTVTVLMHGDSDG